MSIFLYLLAGLVLIFLAGVGGFYLGQTNLKNVPTYSTGTIDPTPERPSTNALTAAGSYANDFTTVSLSLQGEVVSRDNNSLAFQSSSGKTQSFEVDQQVQVYRQTEGGKQVLEGTGTKAIPINEPAMIIVNLEDAKYSVTTIVYPVR